MGKEGDQGAGVALVSGDERFVLPDYSGPGLCQLLGPVMSRGRGLPSERALWVESRIAGAGQAVLLVLDGLGYFQLAERLSFLPNFAGMELSRASSVAPTTTATALTSLTTGCTPAEHGVVGYRVRVGKGSVLNTLRWGAGSNEAPILPPSPYDFQPIAPFFGGSPPIVTKQIFAKTGFSQVHLRGGRFALWSTASGLVSRILECVNRGEPFVYAYYEGIDSTAHQFGLGEQYDLELRLVDFLIGVLVESLPSGCALVITSDHGQVEVKEQPIHIDHDVLANVRFQSGEGRFRWLHMAQGTAEPARDLLVERYGDRARILLRDEAVQLGLFGGVPTPEVAARFGDIALIAQDACSFYDPMDSGAFKLVSRHGALTAAELVVPLLTSVS